MWSRCPVSVVSITDPSGRRRRDRERVFRHDRVLDNSKSVTFPNLVVCTEATDINRALLRVLRGSPRGSLLTAVEHFSDLA
jgi:hypothetical protein